MENIRQPSSGFDGKPTCAICGEEVALESARTDEAGIAVHEECYLLKLKLARATDGKPHRVI